MGHRAETQQAGRGVRLIEAAALLVGVEIASWWIFLVPQTSSRPFAQPFLLMPFIAWASIRFGVSGSASTMVLMSACCIWGTHLGRGDRMRPVTRFSRICPVQAFGRTTSVLSLSLATAVDAAKRSVLR